MTVIAPETQVLHRAVMRHPATNDQISFAWIIYANSTKVDHVVMAFYSAAYGISHYGIDCGNAHGYITLERASKSYSSDAARLVWNTLLERGWHITSTTTEDYRPRDPDLQELQAAIQSNKSR